MYTLERAIAEYTSEVEYLKNCADNGHKTIETDIWDINNEFPDSLEMPISSAIKQWQTKLDELKTGNVNPEDYNY